MTIRIKLPTTEEHPDLTIADIVTHTFAPAKFTPMDKELFGTKWWDYRFMTPCEATLAYIDAFGIEARKIYARDIDCERAEHIHVVTGQKVLEGLIRNEQKAKRAFAGFWRGRQVADAIGMPYGTYIYEALSARMRRWQRTYLPTAAQVYQEGDVERVAARWEALAASRIYFSDHHAYLAQNYRAEPIQKQYSNYLFQRSASSGDRIATLADMVEADRLSLQYLATEQQGIYDRVFASLR